MERETAFFRVAKRVQSPSMKVLALLGAVAPQRRLVSAIRWLLSSAFPLEAARQQLIDLSEKGLGLWNGGSVGRFKENSTSIVKSVLGSDALIIGCPVYDASVPEGLKNLLHHLPVEAVAAKPIGIVVMDGRQQHVQSVEWQLRNMLAWRGAFLVPASVRLTAADFATGLPGDEVKRDLAKLADSIIKLAQVVPRRAGLIESR